MAQARGQRQRGQNNDDPDEGGDSPLTRDEVVDIVNAAVSGHMQRKLPNMLAQAVNNVLDERDRRAPNRREDDRGDDDREDDRDDDRDVPPRRGARNARRDAAPEQPRRGRGRDDDREDDRGRDDRTRGGGDDRTRALEARVKRMEAERATEITRAREAERDQSLREMLGEAGVDKNRLRGAVAVLRDSTRWLDKEQRWTYVSKRDGVDEDLDMSEGVRGWTETDEGKSYLAPPTQPARGAPTAGNGATQHRSGSGSRPATGARSGAAPAQSARDAKVQQRQDAVNNLAGAMDALAGGNITIG